MRLTDVIGQLTGVMNAWDGVLVNPEYVHRGQTITWQTCRRSFLPELLTFDEVATLAEGRQYSFQLLTDGSLFQFFYRYERDGETLSNALLAYYEGRSSETEDDIGESEHDRQTEPGLLARWIRIDYRSASPRCVLHNDCHMHVSGLPGTRIALDGVPTPRQFVETVIGWCYPEVFATHCLGGDDKGGYVDPRRPNWVHERGFPFAEHAVFENVVHLKIPRR